MIQDLEFQVLKCKFVTKSSGNILNYLYKGSKEKTYLVGSVGNNNKNSNALGWNNKYKKENKQN